MIEVEGLEKAYGDLTAVQGLSFQVPPGEVVGLVGPNGAGKTTTLRCLAGIIVPTAGRIRIAGHDLAAEPVAAKRCWRSSPTSRTCSNISPSRSTCASSAGSTASPTPPSASRGLLAELELDGQADGPARASSREGCGRSWRSPAACCTTPRCSCSTSR